MISNNPSVYLDDYRTKQLRAAEENRAKWFYYLYKEGLERGLSEEFAREAMAESGRFLAGDVYRDADSLDAFLACYLDETRKKAYECTAEVQEGAACLKMGYCPMTAAWSKLASEEELPKLCGICEEMLHALCQEKGLSCRIDSAIAAGDAACMISVGEKK